MSYRDISCERKGHVALIKLNRPEALNAVSERMLDEFADLFPQLDVDPEIRVAILTAEGRAFCAGADLKSLLAEIEGQPRPGTTYWNRVAAGFGAPQEFAKPLIVAINGITCAGGLELAMMGDIVLAAQSARIGDCHVNFGVAPGAGGAVTLSRKIPWNAANYLLYTGEMVSAGQMLEWGLVHQVVADDELLETAENLARKIAEKSPLGLRLIKQTVRDGLDMPLPVALRAERAALRTLTKSYDLMEGLTAFGAKRKPEFKGY